MKTSRLIRAWRFARLFLHLLLGLFEVALLFPHRNSAGRALAITRWSRRLCLILGVHVRASGVQPGLSPHNTVLVANHVSWLDIFVMNASTVSRFVAKAEVQAWPLIGWLCERTGTLFVTRERRHDTARVNKQIADALAEGHCIAVFPEGSTSDGLDVAPFNASLLQPAVDAGAQVIPVALRYYGQTGQRTTAAAYIGEMSLLESLLLLVSEPSITVELNYYPALAAAEMTRRELASTARTQIWETVRHDAPKPIQSSLLAATALEIPEHHPVE